MNNAPRTFLLLDPNDKRLVDTARQLLGYGISVLVGGDIETAQAMVRHHRPSAIIMDASFLAFQDIRERLYISGLNVDVPFVVLAEQSQPLAHTSAPYIVLARPLTDAGVRSLMAVQGLPVIGEPPPTLRPTQQPSSLLYALPHEYRTPLTDMIGSASYLHSHADDITPPEIRESSAEMLGAARRLLRITDNFLVYAQIETLAESPLHIDRMRQFVAKEPAMVVYDAAVQRALAHQRSSDLQLSLDIEGVPVAMMEQHLDKIASELVDNALYFSRPGQPVTVQATATPSELVFSVRDQGVGMNDLEVMQIGAYRQFRRNVQEQQGIGLGLVIAKRLVELHGGTFTVSSALGLGTAVTFSIPTKAA
jgi:signal transduction histidine kinase